VGGLLIGFWWSLWQTGSHNTRCGQICWPELYSKVRIFVVLINVWCTGAIFVKSRLLQAVGQFISWNSIVWNFCGQRWRRKVCYAGEPQFPFRLYLNSYSLVIDQIEFVDFILCIANMKSHGTGWYSLCWCAHTDSGLVRADSAHAQNVRTAIWICCEAHAKWLCLKFIVIIKFCKFCNLEYPLITEQVFMVCELVNNMHVTHCAALFIL
jgi:hypothetical protein